MRAKDLYDYQDAKLITCPYCFEKFRADEVVFRSNYIYEGGHANRSDAGLFGSTEINNISQDTDDARRQLFVPYDGPYDYRAKNPDRELETFWQDRGKAAGFQEQDPRWNYPHIVPKSSSFHSMTVISADRTDGKGFVRDSEGWILRVLEPYADNSLPMTKLCPRCHNPFPFNTYGKYETIFISVVGMRASGKTVFINQLLSNLSHYISHTDYTLGQTFLAASVKQEVVAREVPLPDSTDPKVMRRPSVITLRKPASGRDDEALTVVFYDIAGELCVGGEEQSRNEREAVSRFLAFSNALLFLIDPEQVSVFATNGSGEEHISNVMKYVQNLRGDHNTSEQNWDKIPVAVVLTKSDLIPDSAGDSFTHLVRGRNSYTYQGAKVEGFNRYEYDAINDTLRDEFKKTEGIQDALESFAKKGYFAVSAITCGVSNRFVKYGNLYSLSQEDYHKFLSYKDWISGWAGRTPEERLHYPNPGITDSRGEVIVFQPNGKVEDYYAIDTCISAVATVEGGATDVIHLTIKDILQDIIPQGYPVDDPAPNRIEEPFLWILWQLKKIGPKYRRPESPTKRFLESNKAFEDRLLAFQRKVALEEKAFYATEDLDHGVMNRNRASAGD